MDIWPPTPTRLSPDVVNQVVSLGANTADRLQAALTSLSRSGDALVSAAVSQSLISWAALSFR
jgi:hypothetical protein